MTDDKFMMSTSGLEAFGQNVKVMWGRAMSTTAEVSRLDITGEERSMSIQEVERVTTSTQDKLLADFRDPEAGFAELLLRNHKDKLARIKHKYCSLQEVAGTRSEDREAPLPDILLASRDTPSAPLSTMLKWAAPPSTINSSAPAPSPTLPAPEPISLPSPLLCSIEASLTPSLQRSPHAESQPASISASTQESVSRTLNTSLPARPLRGAEGHDSGSGAQLESPLIWSGPGLGVPAGLAPVEVDRSVGTSPPVQPEVTEANAPAIGSMMPKSAPKKPGSMKGKAAKHTQPIAPRRRSSPLPVALYGSQLPRYANFCTTKGSIKPRGRPSNRGGGGAATAAPSKLGPSPALPTVPPAAPEDTTTTTTTATVTTAVTTTPAATSRHVPWPLPIVGVNVGGGLERQGRQEERKEKDVREADDMPRHFAPVVIAASVVEEQVATEGLQASSVGSSLAKESSSALKASAKRPKLSHVLMVKEAEGTETMPETLSLMLPPAAVTQHESPALTTPKTLEQKKAEIEAILKSTPLRKRKRDHDLPLFLTHVEEGDKEAVEVWAAYDYVVTKEGLIKAVAAGHAQIVKILLDKCWGTRWCLEKVGHEKYTLLHLAVFHGHARLVDLLADEMKKACKTQRNKWKCLNFFRDRTGKTAMHYAVEYNRACCIDPLVEAGLSLNSRDSGHFPPLLYVRRDGVEVLKALMEHDADLDVEDHEGRTLLYWATHYQGQREHGWGDVVSLLRSRCAGYGKRMLKDCKNDLSLGIERFWVPVRVETPSSTSDASAKAAEMDVGNADTGDDTVRRRRVAEAELPYPVFAYVNESLNNPLAPADAQKTCKCAGDCLTELGCSCSKANMMGCCPYNAMGDLQDLTTKSYLNECGPECRCDPGLCVMRQTTRGLAVRVQVVRDSGVKGWCVRTVDRLSRGQYVAWYLGEYLQPAEAAARSDYITRTGGTATYQLELGNVIIDANYIGNVARLFNHSCEPNLIMKKVNNGHVHPVAAFYCVRDVEAGEELTFNQDTSSWKSQREASTRLTAVGETQGAGSSSASL